MNLFFKTFFYILSYDVWFYGTHRLMHQAPKDSVRYSIHKIHHATAYSHLSFQDTHVAHSLENLITMVGYVWPLVMGMEWDLTSYLLAFVMVSFRGYMKHDPRCTWVVGHHHLDHHRFTNGNYGEFWIDYLLGTVVSA